VTNKVAGILCLMDRLLVELQFTSKLPEGVTVQ
jgi:hypothetical protein